MELQAIPDIPKCLIKKLETLWNEKELLDFNVNIDGTTIKCHRLILGACSEFFRCLFRSNMKETNENVVTLKGISVGTFNLILKYVYNGDNLLTVDNVIEVWRAVDQLQIDFMIDICEKFAINVMSLNNLEDIYKTAKLLNAKTVLDASKSFMLKHFNDFCKTKTFMELSFEEISGLIIDQDLNVNDEDVVLESIFKWVEYEERTDHIYETKETVSIVSDQQTLQCLPFYDTTFEDCSDCTSLEDTNLIRKNQLVNLLQNVRLCLVRPSFLSKVFNHKLLQGNDKAKNLIFKTTLYRIQDLNYGQWMSASIYRNCSEYGHYGVYTVGNGIIKSLSAASETWHSMTSVCPLHFRTQPCVFDSELYCFGLKNVGDYKSRLQVYQEGAWIELSEIPGRNLITFPHYKFIYILNCDNSELYRINPKLMKTSAQLFQSPDNLINITHAISYEDKILLFSSMTTSGTEETAIHSLDVSSHLLTPLDNLDGPADHMISFRDDNNTYILQKNGNLWSLSTTQSNKIQFKCIDRLWYIERKIHGALTYNGKLVIVYEPNDDIKDKWKSSQVIGLFRSVKYKRIRNCSKFIPAILPKSYF